MTLRQRHLQPEIMDDPALADAEHHAALRGLARLNKSSLAATAVAAEIAKLAARAGLSRIRVLDIASGGGDVTAGVWRQLQRRSINAEILGVDKSPTAVAYAAERSPADPVRYEALDIFADPLPGGYDFVVSTLFLHHLTAEQATELLSRMAAAARVGVVVSDLRRTRRGLWLARLACHTLSRSPVVRYDGPQSVAAAFSTDELGQLAADAGLAGATVRRCWPQRMLLTWRKESHAG